MIKAIRLAAIALLTGVATASAAGIHSPSDALKLSSVQEKTAWQDLTMPSFFLNTAAPAGFSPMIGAVVPRSITTAPVPPKAANDIPVLKPYRFTIVQHKLLIVNPADMKVAAVINS
jgi:hypothetical protein